MITYSMTDNLCLMFAGPGDRCNNILVNIAFASHGWLQTNSLMLKQSLNVLPWPAGLTPAKGVSKIPEWLSYSWPHACHSSSSRKVYRIRQYTWFSHTHTRPSYQHTRDSLTPNTRPTNSLCKPVNNHLAGRHLETRPSAPQCIKRLRI